MEASSVVLVEFEKFLYPKNEDLTVLQIYQKFDQEAIDLLKDLQEYAILIGFCCADPRSTKALKTRLELEGLKFKEVFAISEE